MTNKFISTVCNLLKISFPSISYNESVFNTKTTLAQYDSKDKILYLKRRYQSPPDFFFAIAHELRHIWQIKQDELRYFSNYKSANELDTVSYNLQLAEIDANAFAAIIMIDTFGLAPKFENLPQSVIKTIQEHMDYLISTEFSQ